MLDYEMDNRAEFKEVLDKLREVKQNNAVGSS